MPEAAPTRLPDILGRHQQEILTDWLKLQAETFLRRRDLITDEELRQQSASFLQGLRGAAAIDLDVKGLAWQGVRDLLADISVSRARQGFSPSETATFVFSLKQPLFARLTRERANDARALAEETWTATRILDALGRPRSSRPPASWPATPSSTAAAAT